MRRAQAAMAGSTAVALQAVQSAADGWLAGEAAAGSAEAVTHGDGPADSASGTCSMIGDGARLRLADMLAASSVALVFADGASVPSSFCTSTAASGRPSCFATA